MDSEGPVRRTRGVRFETKEANPAAVRIKTLVAVRGRALVGVSLSVHHAPGVDWVALTREARAACEAVAAEYVTWGELEALVAVEWLVNGAGAFEVGGPGGDNGLSGKKLVAQAYGSAVPIGGGATHGKDPHKVDPRGQALARELAREAVVNGSAREATVWLAYRPGDVTPRWTEVTTVPDDGYTEDAKIEYWQSLYSGYRARMIAAAAAKRKS